MAKKTKWTKKEIEEAEGLGNRMMSMGHSAIVLNDRDRLAETGADRVCECTWNYGRAWKRMAYVMKRGADRNGALVARIHRQLESLLAECYDATAMIKQKKQRRDD